MVCQFAVVTWLEHLIQIVEQGSPHLELMSAGKFAYHMMGCALAGSGDVAAALGCCWVVLGTAVGTGRTAPPHIYLESY